MTKREVIAGQGTPRQCASVEKTRSKAREVLEHLEHTCALARIAVEGKEPEHAAHYLLDTLREIKPMLPGLRQALRATRAA